MSKGVDAIAVAERNRAGRSDGIVAADKLHAHRRAGYECFGVKGLERPDRGGTTYSRNRQQSALRQLGREQRQTLLADTAEHNRRSDLLDLLTHQRRQCGSGRHRGDQ